MEIFCRLLFGHLLADFTFQTNFIANWKRNSFAGLMVHVLLHPLCYVILAWPYLGDVWRVYGTVSLNGWVCVFLAALTHFIQDWLRVTAVNRGWPDNTAFYLWDQLVHLTFLWFLTPVNTQPLLNSWPMIGALFVIVTHCATVTVWFIEKDIYGRDYPETEEKYLSILQRMVVWMAFFLPSPWWYLVPVFVLFTFGRHVWVGRVDFSWTSVILGNTIAILCGVVSRFGLKFHF